MDLNWIAILVAALVPTIIGFIWYNPKVFGKAWMAAADMTEEKMKGANMPLIFGVSFVLSVMLALSLNNIVIHQSNLPGVFIDSNGVPAPDSEAGQYIADFMAKYGTLHRTFSHGAFHGVLIVLFFGLPVLGTNALFERKGFKYIAVNTGYWMLTIAIMGGIICGWM